MPIMSGFNKDLSTRELSQGGIELACFTTNSLETAFSIAPAESLHDEEGLDRLVRATRLAIGAVAGDTPFSRFDKVGVKLRFVTELQPNGESDSILPSKYSRLVTAVRQPGHQTTVMYSGAFAMHPDKSKFEQESLKRQELAEKLIRPLEANTHLFETLKNTANPLRRLGDLTSRVNSLQTTLDEQGKKVLSVGPFTIYKK